MGIRPRVNKGLMIVPGARWWEVALESLIKQSMRFPSFNIRCFRVIQKLYWYSYTWLDTYWFGVPLAKNPMDLWIYQDIIWETRPQVLIETGSYKGGSALYFAHLFDLIGEGRVVSIDIQDIGSSTLSHPRITMIVGSSVSDDVASQVRQIVGNKTAMVSLDSEHSKEHVIREIELYSKFVSVGNYLIVEDTCLRGPGPAKAVEEFLHRRKDFIRDTRREKYMMTSNSGGFLKKIS